MRCLDDNSFHWEGRWVDVIKTNGSGWKRWIRTGMPRIDEAALDSIVFLYQSTDDAWNGVNAEGTGFIVGYPAIREDLFQRLYHHCYIVTNEHVVGSKGHAPVARINRYDHDLGTETFGHDYSDWVTNKEADIAILPLRLQSYMDFREYKAFLISTTTFITEGMIGPLDIGVGDDVFMIGHLVDHPEPSEKNEPYARFGNISKMPSIEDKPYTKYDGYKLDMRSRVGFSGSPVFIYKVPDTNLRSYILRSEQEKQFMFGFLGIHWGGYNELWEIDERKVKTRGMSGMTVATPAWEILKMLESDEFMKQRKDDEENNIPENPDIQEESVSNDNPEMTGDDILKNMLNMPPETHEEMKDKK